MPSGAADRPDSGQDGRGYNWLGLLDLPPLKWLVADLLIDGGTSLLVGHPKAGKSTLARVLAATVAGYGSGRFLGREVLKPCPVVYYSPDELPETSREHFIYLLPTDPEEARKVRISFYYREPLARLEEIVSDEGAGLLIVDTLGALFAEAGLSDGDYMQWQPHLQRVRDIGTKTGAHVSCVHHARKNGGERSLAVLGSAAIAGKMDTIINVETVQAGGGWVRNVSTTQRAGVEIARQRLTLAGDGWLTVEPSAVDGADDPAADAIAEARAMKRAGETVREIADKMGRPVSTVGRWVRGVQ